MKKALVLFGLAYALSTSALAGPVSVTANRAYDFTNSIGIGVHMGQTGNGVNSYGGVTNTVNSIAYLGFKHVRDSFGGAFAGYYITPSKWTADPTGKLKQFAAAGIGFDVIVGVDPASLYKAQSAAYAPYIETLEGPNEPEVSPCVYSGLSGWSACAGLQKAVYNLAKTKPELSGKQIINLSLQRPDDSAAVGNLAANVDYNNVHAYPVHGRAPYTAIPAAISATTDAPGKPFIVTETGYATYNPAGNPRGVSGKDYGDWTPEDVEAKYLPSAVLDDFVQGVAKTYVYELFDEAVDTTNTNAALHNGLFRYDGSAKPVATAFHNLTTILQDTSASAKTFKPKTLSYTLTQSLGLSAPVFQTALLQKASGAYELVIWQEPTLWVDTSNVEQPAATNFVQITLPTKYSAINTYDIMKSSTATATVKNANTITVQVVDHPVIVELMP